jgi:hypothetical protein
VSPADGDPQLLYLEPDDEITSVVRRLRGADVGRVVLVAPGRSRATSSVVALRLLARAAADTGRSMALVADASTRALAGEAGIAAFASVGDATSGTPSPAEPMTPTRAPIHVVRGAGFARSQPPKAAPPTDGLDETVAVHLPPPSRPTGGSRRFRGGGLIPRWPWLAALLVVALAVGAALLPGATVRITPVTEAVGPIAYPISIPVIGHVTDELESSKPGTATGERLEKVPATGIVTFSNWNSFQVDVPQGTQVSVGGTIAFLTIERISVPKRRSFLNPEPGQRSVGVVAVEPGTGGNVGAGAIDTIDDLSVRVLLRAFDDNTNRLVVNDDATTGGVETSHPVIQQSDIDAVVAAIEADLQQQLSDALDAEADRLYAGAPDTEVPVVNIPDDLLGTEDETTFELRGTLEFDRAYGSKPDAETAARAALLGDPEATPLGTTILEETIDIEMGNATVTGDSLQIRASVNAQAAAKIDHAAARDLVAGKTVEEARRALADLGEVEIDLWPPWVDKVPVLEFRIEVREEVHSPTDGASPTESVH